MANERNDKDLAELLKAARAIPGSGARGKAVSAMTAAAAAGGSRRRSWISWRRAVSAAAFVVVLGASGFWLLPKRHTVALADLARAMANVESVHFTGSARDYGTGKRRPVEGWVKGRKFRMWRGGREDVADDGETLLLVSRLGSPDSPLIAEIRPSGDWRHIGTSLDLFQGERAVQATFEGSGRRLREWRPVTLPDGRQGVELVLWNPASPEGGSWVMTVDADTDLLVQWVRYDGEGEIWEKVERIEYDIEIPDSIFTLEIPGNALVFDERRSAPAEVRAQREKIAEQLNADPSARQVWKSGSAGGTWGGGYHRDFYIRCLDAGGMMIYALAGGDRYYVLGRALAYTTDGSGFWQVVEDAEIEAPTADGRSLYARLVELAEWESRLSPEVAAAREAKAQALRDAGWQQIAKFPSGMSGSDDHGSMMWFRCQDENGIEVYYLPDRGAYYVIGKALLWGVDFEEVVVNAEFLPPGEPERLR